MNWMSYGIKMTPWARAHSHPKANPGPPQLTLELRFENHFLFPQLTRAKPFLDHFKSLVFLKILDSTTTSSPNEFEVTIPLLNNHTLTIPSTKYII